MTEDSNEKYPTPRYDVSLTYTRDIQEDDLEYLCQLDQSADKPPVNTMRSIRRSILYVRKEDDKITSSYI